MDTNEPNAPAVEPVTEAPATASTPSPGSEAPAAAPIATDGAAAVVPVEPAPAEHEPAKMSEPVAEPVEPAPMTEREKLMGILHHVVESVEDMGGELETHARAAVVAGEAEVHAALARLATLFGEFRNGLMNAGKALPAKLETEAAGLVAKAKG